MSASSLRRRVVPLAVAGTMVLGVATALSAPAGAAAPTHSAATAKVISRSLYGSLTVTSSKHKKLTLSVSASPAMHNSSPSVSVSASNGTETHYWSFRVHKSAVTANHGNGTITVSKKLSHGYAVVKLKFSKAGTTKGNKCSQSTPSTVKGLLYLNTKAAWGKLGSKSHKLKFKGYESDSLNGTCHYSVPCHSGTSWDTYSNNGGSSLFGGTSGKKGYVYASRYVKLGSWGDRSDYVSAKTKRPTLHGSGAKAVYTVKGTGLSHGSIVYHSLSKPSTLKSTCKLHGKKMQQTSYDYYTVKVSSHFAVHAQIYGSLKASNTGSFSVVKVG